MKTLYSTLLAAALLAGPTGAFSQTPGIQTPGTVAAVTVALTLTSTVEGTMMKDPETGRVLTIAEGGGPTFENSWTISKNTTAGDPLSVEQNDERASKLKVAKLGNKEILDAMLANGELFDSTSITGWSIVQVITEGQGTFVATRKIGTETFNAPVMIEFGGSFEEAPAKVEAYKRVRKETGLNLATPPFPTLTETQTYSWKTVGGFTFGDLMVSGLFTASGKLVKLATGEKDENNLIVKDPEYNKPMTVDVQVLGAQKLANVLGLGSDPLTAMPALIEGSVSIAAGAAKDVSVYLQ